MAISATQVIACKIFAGAVSNPKTGVQGSSTAAKAAAASAQATALVALALGSPLEEYATAAIEGFEANPYFNQDTAAQKLSKSVAIANAVNAYANGNYIECIEATIKGVVSNPVVNNDNTGAALLVDQITDILAAGI